MRSALRQQQQHWHMVKVILGVRSTIDTNIFGKEFLSNALTPFGGNTLSNPGTFMLQRPTESMLAYCDRFLQACNPQECLQLGMVFT